MQHDANVSEVSAPALEDLMERYQQADSGAAATLVDELSPRLYRYFSGQLGSQTDAADMLQDTWLRIHRVRHTYRPGVPLLPWVYAIAHRVRVDGYRKRRRTSREIGVDVLPEPSPDRGNAPEERRGFERLLASLPESQREVLAMLKVDGLSIEEVARATSSTSGAVKQKAHRAYERLRRILRPADVMAVRK